MGIWICLQKKEEMISKGYLEKSGIKKGQVYRLSGKLYKQLGESIAYIREKGIDEVRYPELIIKYVKEYGTISNTQTRELLGVDIYKASKLLRMLVQTGKLEKLGQSKKTVKYGIKGE